MTNKTPTEQSHEVIFREINLSAEIKRMYGTKWNSPELAYEFGDRKFYLRTEDAGIYQPQIPIQEEGGAALLEEGGSSLIIEKSGP